MNEKVAPAETTSKGNVGKWAQQNDERRKLGHFNVVKMEQNCQSAAFTFLE